jgi:hypothetical protein
MFAENLEQRARLHRAAVGDALARRWQIAESLNKSLTLEQVLIRLN